MPVHHRLRLLTFPMRTSRLCSLWPDMRPLRFRRVPFGRDRTFDPGGATASRIAMPHILPSTVPSVSASATFFLSWLHPPPHPITVSASHPPAPTTAQHSLPGGALPPYRGRSFTGWNASASPDAPELKNRAIQEQILGKPLPNERVANGTEKQIEPTDWARVVQTNLTRLGAVAIMFFLVEILVPQYRYNIRMSSFYDARADSVRLAEKMQDLGDIATVMTPNIDFGKA